MPHEEKNTRVLLDSRPPSFPSPANFRIVTDAVPKVGRDEVLLKTLWLSIEPYMILGMKGSAPHSAKTGSDRMANLANGYLGGVEVGTTMYGPTVSRVVQSNNRKFAVGDVVSSYSGWQEYAVDDCTTLRKLEMGTVPVTAALGVLGIPGMTAYAGMKLIARPSAGETVVVSAALGPVGSVVGQMARIAGARAVGIASGAEKCRYLENSLGFDAAVDRLSTNFAQQLAAACPRGIDVYFENAGGAVWWAAFPLLNEFARVPVCGLVAKYSGTHLDTGTDRTMEVLERLLLFRIKAQGLFVFDHADLEPQFLQEMLTWVSQGKIKYREDIVDGLSNAPQALVAVLTGKNVGKLLVRVAA
jgi:NADPH-dependent curcumin reductase CurA